LALKQILLGCQKQIALAQKTVNEFLGVDLPQAGFNAIINGEQTAKTGSAKRIKERRKKDDADPFHVEKFPNGDEVIEGVFNGFQMIAGDGTPYLVPENYASKSKLVEGDLLKLTITPQGRFIYKQISPLERELKRGVLMYHAENDQFLVNADGNEYHLLKASVTYYKGEIGDEVIIVVPKGLPSHWAAVDNIVKSLPGKIIVPELASPKIPEKLTTPAVADILELKAPAANPLVNQPEPLPKIAADPQDQLLSAPHLKSVEELNELEEI